jgi:hypothetical protein
MSIRKEKSSDAIDACAATIAKRGGACAVLHVIPAQAGIQ